MTVLTRRQWRLNLFSTNVPLLTPRKHDFRGYSSGTLVENGLSVCVLNPLPQVSTLPSLLTISLLIVDIKIFKLSRDLTCITWSMDHAHVRCRWSCNVFNLSCDLTEPLHWGAMRIYWLKLLAVCHHLINLVTIIIVIVEMFVTWHLVNTCLKGDMNL